MYVPNYIPPPIEVPGNATEKSYLVRLGFVRRISVLHFLSLLLIGGISMLALPSLPILTVCIALGCVLLALSLVRIGTRATRNDLLISCALLPLLIMVLAMLVRLLNHGGMPVGGLAVGVGCSVLYALSCGRDFSFVGQYLMSLIASTVILAVAATALGFGAHEAAFLLGSNAIFLFYVVYDLASLLARRRIGEEAAAVVDLYRDVFNVFGYIVRVARHWKKHRIWLR